MICVFLTLFDLEWTVDLQGSSSIARMVVADMVSEGLPPIVSANATRPLFRVPESAWLALAHIRAQSNNVAVTW